MAANTGAKSAGSKAYRKSLQLTVSLLALGFANVALAQEVGDEIINPETGETETIREITESGAFITNSDRLIISGVMVGDVIQQDDDAGGTVEVQIIDVALNPSTGLPVSATGNNGEVFDLVLDLRTDLGVDFGDTGGVSPINYPDGAFGFFSLTPRGDKGRGGSGRFLGIGSGSKNGRAGGEGPPINIDIESDDIQGFNDGDVDLALPLLPGIVVSSTGGDGGNGGGEIAAGSGGRGGAAGPGGRVTVTNNVDVSTGGFFSYGILIQSRSGNGGRGGGGGFIGGSGGSGGAGEQGGTVQFTNLGDVTTLEIGSTGILVQSLGGHAGDGGNAYGVVGIAGNALQGGDGGRVTASNFGNIRTDGLLAAPGLVVQSIGGSGGDAGNAGAILALGNDSGSGGNGGFVNVTNEGLITTVGAVSSGIIAQSIGGGGGNGGRADGLIGLGSSGGAGGIGRGVEVTNRAGADIFTLRAFSSAIMAQSIGGGGGNGGNSAGLVGIGGGGEVGGAGGTVSVTNDAILNTFGAFSRGIFAQSIGGGGGAGGDSTGLIAVGGNGSTTSDGNMVTVGSQGAISTFGRMASGIEAQSIGGGGGSGGSASSLLLSIGGSGGGGGNGGVVHVNSSANIETAGDDSFGILAQSIGGGGGNGGSSTSSGFFAGVAVGGSGGTAGDSQEARVTLFDIAREVNGEIVNFAPSIITSGDRSDAIFVQSIGGGGGNGGGALSAVAGYAGAASFAIGGRGGAAGDGGLAMLMGRANISTSGEDADGIVVESVGGGGGNGGYAVSIAVAAGETAAGSLSFAMGGSGGSGGSGGNAELIDGGGTIRTSGDLSDGLLVQSVGGGGGNGGSTVSIAGAGAGAASATVSIGIGGSGGRAGNGGVVDATFDGDILTEGENADTATIQSVGGGGGNGGFNVSAAVAVSGAGSLAAAIGLGGKGGAGGFGSDVTADLSGSYTALGDLSNAITVQSVGGGGGNGGLNVSGAISATGGVVAGGSALAVGLGGAGGSGGNGGFVTSTITGDATTVGDEADVVTIQSLGGGGGNGGINVSGAVSGAIGDFSAAASVAFGIGGFGGGGGDASLVDSDITGDISSVGDGSTGLTVQSAGRGGGNGGVNISGAVSLSLSTNASISGAVGIGVGGFGGGGGNGGEVESYFEGNINTFGDRSGGAVVQSVGGGGGNGGVNVTGAVSISSNSSAAVGLGIGGFGGGGGDASSVDADFIGNITTRGIDSDALVVQSQAGAGGNGAVNVAGTVSFSRTASGAISLGVGGFGGGGGDAGNVDLLRIGDTFSDLNSDGIIVQSVGGGGGKGGVNVSGAFTSSELGSGASVSLGIGGFGGGGGDAGEVEATITGDVFAGANGVIAQSIGGAGGIGRTNVSGGVTLTSEAGTGIAAVGGVGGFGGDGGDAKLVRLTIEGSEIVSLQPGIETVGVLSQSVGGGGGKGGLNVSGGFSVDGSFVGGVGGFGGDGGRGGAVVTNVTANVTIEGKRSRGIVAQSIGGGGGNGGVNVSGGVTLNGDTPSLSLGVGGFGGEGNSSDFVNLTQLGDITIGSGSATIGILAQSVAGGGGDGGANVALNLSNSDSYNAVIGVGGFAGDGANASDVNVVSDGNILVENFSLNGIEQLGELDIPREEREFEDLANGILVQSVGGGGTGGFNLGGVLSPFGSPVVIGIGGSGGAGGNAGNVSLNRGLISAGLLRTTGNQANGITVQSVGGGGGNAGMNFGLSLSRSSSPSTRQQQFQFIMGGNGGAAGEAGTVRVEHVGDIYTAGRESDGLLAQSIGGGGGSANFTIGAGYNGEAYGANIAVGGGTGDGADGKLVSVQHTGLISTLGENSTALFAQSVGGGGGNTALTIAASLGNRGTVDIGIGRSGGTGGAGGNVVVTVDGALRTSGDSSVGLFAQSVGNGGGVSSATSISAQGPTGGGSTETAQASLAVGLAGGGGGHGGEVVAIAAGQIETTGDESHAIQVQSVGGGGGVGGLALNPVIGATYAVTAGFGGTGGMGGFGGRVFTDNDATLLTSGEGAHGIFAQSIGNGGGAGGGAVSATFQSGSGATSDANLTAALNVGGDGGKGGFGGEVEITNAGDIQTQGDRSYGINAQSTGGGGGTGGIAASAAYSGSQSNTRLGLNIGGSSDGGADGGLIVITNEALIDTFGEESFGIRAQSIGGGGGDAGLVLNLALNRSTSESPRADTTDATFNIGVAGGDGGKGGDIRIHNTASGVVQVRGDGAHAIVAQSIGGGGGNGSSVISAQLTGGGSSNFPLDTSLGLAIGGDGGAGAASGDVSVTNDGQLLTMGENSNGIFAQSISGGGGNGGVALAGNFSLRSADSLTAGLSPTFAIGGAGGSGGDAGSVTVRNQGTITATAAGSTGILAQSIAQGGGNANIGVGIGGSTGNPIGSLGVTAVSNALSFGIGGIRGGGDGGSGGTVSVFNSGDIIMLGDNSTGIRAESINGGGGSVTASFEGIVGFAGCEGTPLGGFGLCPGLSDDDPASEPEEPLLVIDLGGDEHDRMNAGNVTCVNTGNIVVSGANSTAMSCGTTGGGGGNLSYNVRFADPDTAPADIRASFRRTDIKFRAGGRNGTDNLGGNLDFDLEGIYSASGAASRGLEVQSIGGGGGSATFNIVDAINGMGEGSFDLGGVGSSGGHGGLVTFDHAGSAEHIGNLSTGYRIQSVGGGGGSVSLTFSQNTPDTGSSDGNQAGVSPAQESQAANQAGVRTTAAVSKDQKRSIGFADGFALSPSFDLAYDPVLLAMGDLSLKPDFFDPSAAQLRTLGGSIASSDASETAETGAASQVMATPVTLSLGGDGGSNNNGGDVDATLTGDVLGSGDLSSGVFIQSVGAGGGILQATGLGTAQLDLGGRNAASGDGGAIRLSRTGDLHGEGANASGVFLQSVGGGGGVAWLGSADMLSLNIGGETGAFGKGGTISFANTGTIFVEGAGAIGVAAQSIGGGGGAVISVDEPSASLVSAEGTGDGGDIDIDLDGDVIVMGTGGSAIVLQSIAGGGGFISGSFAGSAGGTGTAGAITLDVDGDVIASGSGTAAILAQSVGSSGSGNIDIALAADHNVFAETGVVIDGGASNRLVNDGAVFSSLGLEGQAIRATTGDDAVLNNALLVGLVDLGEGANSLTNAQDAVFITGSAINLGGAGNLLLNAGTLAPGDAANPYDVSIDGDFTQVAGATMIAELDFGQDAIDNLTVSGDVAVAGTFDVDLLDIPSIAPGSFRKDLIRTNSSLVDNGAQLVTQASLVINYDLFAEPDALVLGYDVDFDIAGLAGNRRRVGQYINEIQLAGSSEQLADLVTRLVTISDFDVYSDALTQLTPEIYAEQQAQTILNAQGFARDLGRCGGTVASRTADELGDCAWFGFDIFEAGRDQDLGFPRVEHDGIRFSAGFQKAFGEDSTINLGFGFRQFDSTGFDARWQSSTDTYLVGLGHGFNTGKFRQSTQVALGLANNDTSRLIDVTQPYRATSDREDFFAALTHEMSREFDLESVWIRPSLELGASYYDARAFSETGARELNLDVQSRQEGHAWAAPRVEFGFKTELPNGLRIEPYAAAGFTYFLTDAKSVVNAQFAGAPGTVSPFSAESLLDRGHASFAAGLELSSEDRVAFSIAYEGTRSSNRDADWVSANINIRF